MITVREVLNKKDLRTFVQYPSELYKDNPYFVPATYADDLEDWDRKKNPAFEYCEAKCFLAFRDNKVVGRIGAILSHKSNKQWNTNRMRFTQVDFIDDDEVVDALFKAVFDYAKEKGCDEVHGPLGFTDLDREGMLVEGFEELNLFFTYYNAPYYIKQMERLGFIKDVDWVEYRLFAEGSQKSVEALDKVAKRIEKMYKLHVMNLKNRLQALPYIKEMFELVNIAYAPLYGVVELSDKQIKRYLWKFLPLINVKYVAFVMDENNKMVGFSVVSPDMSKAFKKSNGRLLPFGWLGVLKALKKNDTIDMFLVAVHPDYQGKGVNGIIMNHIIQNAIQNGMKYAETGPMLETNEKIRSQWTRFNMIQHKRRRCWVKKV